MLFVAFISLFGSFFLLKIKGDSSNEESSTINVEVTTLGRMYSFWDYGTNKTLVNEYIAKKYDTEDSEDVVTSDIKGKLILIRIKVEPNATATILKNVEVHRVTMQVDAPDVGEQANEEVLYLLSDVLKVKMDQLSIFQGRNETMKIVKLLDYKHSPPEAVARITSEMNIRRMEAMETYESPQIDGNA